MGVYARRKHFERDFESILKVVFRNTSIKKFLVTAGTIHIYNIIPNFLAEMFIVLLRMAQRHFV